MGLIKGQDSVFTNYYNNNIGNGINVNTSIPDDPSSIFSGGCIPIVVGCLNPGALNYNDWYPEATDSTSYGDGVADNFNYADPWLNINTDDSLSCIEIVYGCIDLDACNYDSGANFDNQSCEYPQPYRDCNDICYIDSDEDGVCNDEEVPGCTDSLAFNFNPLATDQLDSLCIPILEGCTEEGYYNYDSLANTSVICIPFISGCADSSAFNYDPSVNDTLNIECYPVVLGCMIEAAYNFNDYDGDSQSNPITGINGVDVNTQDNSCIPRIFGCTNRQPLITMTMMAMVMLMP